MKTKTLLSASALFMAALGLAMTFAPQEVMMAAGARAEGLGTGRIRTSDGRNRPRPEGAMRRRTPPPFIT